jgi:lysophospholipase L1-like esterase
MIAREVLKSHRKQWLARALIAGGICLLAGELIARFGFGLGTPPLSVTHPTIEYMFRPNQDVRRFENRILINEYGMRSGSFPEKKGESEYRVMIFGDSIINGGNLTDHSELATTEFQNYLEKRLNCRVNVGNISAGSWGPGNWRAYLNHFGAFDADVIFLVVSSHDYADNPTFKPLSELTHPTVSPTSALWEGIERYLPRYLPQFGRETNRAEPHLASSDEVHEDVAKGLNDLRDFLLIAQESAKQVVVLQYWSKDEIASGKPEPGNIEIKKLCDELSLPVISLEQYFSDDIQSGRNPFRDEIHPNDDGQKLLFQGFVDAYESLSRE